MIFLWIWTTHSSIYYTTLNVPFINLSYPNQPWKRLSLTYTRQYQHMNTIPAHPSLPCAYPNTPYILPLHRSYAIYIIPSVLTHNYQTSYSTLPFHIHYPNLIYTYLLNHTAYWGQFIMLIIHLLVTDQVSSGVIFSRWVIFSRVGWAINLMVRVSFQR